MNFKSIVVACCSLWLVPGAAAVELQNPSFEKAGVELDKPADWPGWGPGLSRQTGWLPFGDGQAVVGYRHAEVQGTANAGMYQNVEGAKAGTRYTFSVYACVNDPEENRNGVSKVELRLEGTHEGHQLTLASREYEMNQLAVGKNWSRLQVTGTAATDSLRVLVIVYPAEDKPRGGAIKFDQAHVEIKPEGP